VDLLDSELNSGDANDAPPTEAALGTDTTELYSDSNSTATACRTRHSLGDLEQLHAILELVRDTDLHQEVVPHQATRSGCTSSCSTSAATQLADAESFFVAAESSSTHLPLNVQGSRSPA
jgi:hypothetical protein